MGENVVDQILWATGLLLVVALFSVLILRKRYRTLPWFTAWIGFQMTGSALLFVIWSSYPSNYGLAYWCFCAVDILLQIMILSEIARSVLCRNGVWVQGAKSRFLLLSALGAVVAAVMAAWVKPLANTPLEAWSVRGNLFTTLLVCLTFTSILSASAQFGLHWRSHVMRVGYGLTVWSLASFAVDALHGYWGATNHFKTLEHFDIAVWELSLVYWSGALWVPEEEPKEIPPALIDDLLHIHADLNLSPEHSPGPN